MLVLLTLDCFVSSVSFYIFHTLLHLVSGFADLFEIFIFYYYCLKILKGQRMPHVDFSVYLFFCFSRVSYVDVCVVFLVSCVLRLVLSPE